MTARGLSDVRWLTDFSRPVVTMTKLLPVALAKRGNEIQHELFLWFLLKCHAQELQSGWLLPLTHVIRETAVPGETKVKAGLCEFIKPSVIQTLHAESMNGLDVVSFRAKRRDKFPGEIFVEKNFHAGCRSFLLASSARVPRTDSSLKLG